MFQHLLIYFDVKVLAPTSNLGPKMLKVGAKFFQPGLLIGAKLNISEKQVQVSTSELDGL
jgi:hypothetical protein